MIIRELIGEDTEQYRIVRRHECLELYPQSFGASAEEFYSEPIEQTRKSIEESFQKTESFLLGAFNESHLIGIINFSRNPGKKRRHTGLITRVYVTPSEQRKGIAAALLDETLRRAKLIPEMRMIHLKVIENNEPAIKLYSSRGFQKYGIEPKAFKFDDGSFSAGDIFMILDFNLK